MHGNFGWWHVEILQVKVLPYKLAPNKDPPDEIQ